MTARHVGWVVGVLTVWTGAWGAEGQRAGLRCVVTESVPVDYLAPEQSHAWALCVDVGGRRVSRTAFPQSPVAGRDRVALASDVPHHGRPTMKLTYTTGDAALKRITLFRKDGFHIYPKNEGVTDLDGMGVWVYGNGSGDLLEYYDTWGNVFDPKKRALHQPITWTGWRFVDLPFNKRYRRFWGITITVPKGTGGKRPPLYFARLTPRQRKVFLPAVYAHVDPLASRVDGQDFGLSINVPPGQYEVELGIAPPLLAKLQRAIGFRVTADGDRTVLDYQGIQPGKPWRRFPVTADTDGINLRVRHTKQCRAWVNAVRLYTGRKRLVTFDLGFDPKDEAYFADGVNLVPNPGFEATGARGLPVGWKRAGTKPAPKPGPAVAIDSKVFHTGQRSLRIVAGPKPVVVETATRQFWPVGGNPHYGAAIDYTRHYTLSAWVRCRDVVGTARLALVWNRLEGKTVERRDKQGRAFPAWSNAAGITQLGVTQGVNVVGAKAAWTRVSVSARPPHGADHVVFRLHTDMRKGTIWFDDLRLDGFGDAPVEIIASQGGYHPLGHKHAIVACRMKQDAGGRFAVTPIGKATPVHRGPLAHWGADEWGRHIWIADFGALRQPGTYELSVVCANGLAVKGRPFAVGADHYRRLVAKVRHYLHVARCGMAVPGWHKACHLDDAVTPGGKHYDMTGGWHDAGSVDKQIGSAAHIMVHLSTIALEAFDRYPPVTVEGLELPDVLDEALWGADQLLKMQLPDGRIFVACNPTRGGLVTSQNNIPGDFDDRILIGPYGAPPSIKLLAMSRTARALKARQPAKLARYMKAIERSYPLMKDDSGAVQVDLDLWRLTGQDAYMKRAAKRVPNLLAGLKQRDYYWRRPDYVRLVSLIEYARAVPQGDLARDIQREVQALLDDVLEPLTRHTPYGHVTNWSLLFPRAIDGWVENNHVITESAYFLTQAYRLLGDRRCLDLADAQLQWIMGRNPTGGSMIAGVGTKFQMPCTAISYTCPAHRNGLVTGAVLRACSSGNGTLGTYYSGGLPRQFPVIYTASDVPGNMFAGGEIWSPVSAKFMGVCYELDRALAQGAR